MIFIPDIDALEPDVTVGDFGHNVMHQLIHYGLFSLKNAVVNLSNTTLFVNGNQTVAGAKTFDSAPVVPLTPSNVGSIASKKYMDDTGTNTQPLMSGGTTAQYYRGDKAWANLNATSAGLNLLNNTSDLNKPISTAQQAALDTKQPSITATTSADYYRGDKTFQPLNKTAAGLSNVDNTSDLNKPISSAQSAALMTKQLVIPAGETFQYLRGDGFWTQLTSTTIPGLESVNNTSDLNKPISIAQQNALDLKASKYDYANRILADTIPGDKTFTTAPKISTGATVGYFWTATSIDGLGVVGSWQPKGTVVTTVNYDNTTVGRPSTFPPTIGSTATTAAAGNHTHTKAGVGLGNVDNTSDSNKPVSSATQTALNGLVPNTRQLVTSASFTPVGAINADKTITIATGGIGVGDVDIPVKMESLVYISTLGVRSVGLGQVPDGFTVPFNMNIISVRYRVGTLDGSGSTTAVLLKNGVAVSGTSATANFSPTATMGSWSFAANDNLSVSITAVGTNPGSRLTAEILYVKT